MTMTKTDTIINTLQDMQNRGVTYSMNGSRVGTDGTADCSGAIYKGLINAGCPTLPYPFSTESEEQYLLSNGYMKISDNQNWNAERGDIFIWGRQGASSGGDGHTGIFIDSQTILHCNYTYNGVSKNNYDDYYTRANPSYVRAYRPINDTQKPTTPPQQNDSGWKAQKATFKAGERLPFSKDTNPNSPAIAWVEKDGVVKYDAYKAENGYIWIRQPRANGGYYYLAVGKEKNGVNVTPFGTFY